MVKNQALTNIVILTVEELIDRLILVPLPSDNTHISPASSACVSNFSNGRHGGRGHGRGRGHMVDGVKVTYNAPILEKMGTLKIGALTYMDTRTKLLILLKLI